MVGAVRNPATAASRPRNTRSIAASSTRTDTDPFSRFMRGERAGRVLIPGGEMYKDQPARKQAAMNGLRWSGVSHHKDGPGKSGRQSLDGESQDHLVQVRVTPAPITIRSAPRSGARAAPPVCADQPPPHCRRFRVGRGQSTGTTLPRWRPKRSHFSSSTSARDSSATPAMRSQAPASSGAVWNRWCMKGA